MIIIVLSILCLVLTVAFVSACIKHTKNQPTMEGVIISLIIGMLPLYLILCFFGIMGEERSDLDRP